MKKSIRIGDGIAEFFGTHDGNIKYLESLLRVQVHIDGENNITIDGDDHDVQLVERLVEDYAQLRSEGVKFTNGDLKSIIRISEGRAGDRALVRISGRILSGAAAGRLLRSVRVALARGRRELTIDLAGLAAIDCGGIGALSSS